MYLLTIVFQAKKEKKMMDIKYFEYTPSLIFLIIKLRQLCVKLHNVNLSPVCIYKVHQRIIDLFKMKILWVISWLFFI